MNKEQLKKYSAITTASFMTLQLAACGAPVSAPPTPKVEDTSKTVPTNPGDESGNSDSTTSATVDDSIVNVKDSEFAKLCDKWEEGEDGSAKCIDENSPYFSQHFFNGLMFGSLAAMVGSQMYKSKTEKRDNNGHGGGSGGYSGGNKNGAVNNGIVVPPASSNNNATNNSPGSKDTSTPNNSSNSKDTNTNSSKNNSRINLNKNSNSGGKTESNSASKGNSNSGKSSSSYSSGKSGFSSGGASRGGSSGS